MVQDPPPPGAVGGYVRLSRVTFPPECAGLAERRAHVDGLRQTRKRELQADAAKDGEVITLWYDDMGISGRGKYLDRRVGFECARQDAGRGVLRTLYARDLSRLFRDVVQQELWFAEMEERGVRVRAQDLPFVADAATQRLVRQWMGAYHEYSSARLSALISASMRERIRSGLSLGQGTSRWGLRYNAATRAYDLDTATADRIRLVFETFNQCEGNAGRTARHLNALAEQRHPRATLTPSGLLWSSGLVLAQVQAQAYRRVVQFADLRVPAPERIPEVVPPGVVAEADRWLAAHRPRNRETYDRRHDTAPHFTYAFLIRCGCCGGPMHPRPSHPDGPTQWVAYRCDTSNLGGCPMGARVQQRRLHPLLGRALEEAFARHAAAYLLTQPRLRSHPWAAPDSGAAQAALDKELAGLERQRERFLELFALGVITDPAELQDHLGRLRGRAAFLEAQRLAAGARRPSPGATARALPRERFEDLRRRFEAQWPRGWEALNDPDKHALLTELGAQVSLRVTPRAAPPRPLGIGPRDDALPGTGAPPASRPRAWGGVVTLDLELSAFGLVGARAIHVAETAAEAEAYRQWHLAATHRPRHPRAREGERRP